MIEGVLLQVLAYASHTVLKLPPALMPPKIYCTYLQAYTSCLGHAITLSTVTTSHTTPTCNSPPCRTRGSASRRS